MVDPSNNGGGKPVEVFMGMWCSYEDVANVKEAFLVVAPEANGWLVVGETTLRLHYVHQKHFGWPYLPITERGKASPMTCWDFYTRASAKAKTEQEQLAAQAAEEIRREREWMEFLKMIANEHGAKAIIVAEQVEDRCRPMEDFYGTTTVRRVLLTWSKSTRTSFKELRQASLLLPETNHLSATGREAEHRENYSQGAGNYLKTVSRYESGWEVRKEKLDSSYQPRPCEIPPSLHEGVFAVDPGTEPKPPKPPVPEQDDGRPLAKVLRFPSGEPVE